MNKDTFILMFSSKGDQWGTPFDLYRRLNDEFHFTTDPCTDERNRLGCKVFYTKQDDGLAKRWYGNVFCNPPYGKEVKKWVARCAHYAAEGNGTVVMLIPSRTDTRWWLDYIWNNEIHRPRDGVEIRFIKGRLRFENPEHKLASAPFPSVIIVFRPKTSLTFFQTRD